MTKISDLHKKWMKDSAYVTEYEALEEEFALAVAKARRRSKSIRIGTTHEDDAEHGGPT
jgi:hypothetical protein